jgi:D-alanyl-D-alanine carboxypeptidase/D-alanyl-D-alanine-endopeptidase (penicillin-binding protein 4)
MSSSRRRSRRLTPLAIAIALVLTAACAARARGPAARASPPSADTRRAVASDLARLFSSPPAGRAIWGVVIESLDKPGDVVFSLNPDVLLVPASNTKILTVAAAADRLGWGYTFETSVGATTPVDRDGIIRGDVIVAGSGDPTMGNRTVSSAPLTAFADALWQQGVRRIEGRIIGDDDAFVDEPLGAGWAWDDLPFSYSAPVGALNYNENTAAVIVRPGASANTAATGTVADRDAGFTLSTAVATTAADVLAEVDIERPAGSIDVRLRGHVAVSADPLTRYVAVDNPTLYFAEALRSALVTRGIVVVGPAGDVDAAPPGPLPADAPVLLHHRSPPLSEIATRMMKSSQNLYAETFLRTVGRAEGHPGSTSAGLAAIRETLIGWGIEAGSLAQADGSGLSRYNLITTSALTRVLAHMYRDSRLRDAWLATFPVAGIDGTLEKRMKGTAAEGRVLAKTGSLSAVRALSGYIHTAAGEWLVFSILANNFAPSVASADVDKVAEQAIERVVRMTRIDEGESDVHPPESKSKPN